MVEDIRNVCNFTNKDKHLSPFITKDFNDAWRQFIAQARDLGRFNGPKCP